MANFRAVKRETLHEEIINGEKVNRSDQHQKHS
jgi:hypothetical protein